MFRSDRMGVLVGMCFVDGGRMGHSFGFRGGMKFSKLNVPDVMYRIFRGFGRLEGCVGGT